MTEEVLVTETRPDRVGFGDQNPDGTGYYGKPVLNPPVWTWEVPWYFFAGGLAGASATTAAVARLTGDHHLARVTGRVAAAAGAVSPALLMADLGRPTRFLNMLRVFKPSSPMSVGSWVLVAFAPAAIGAAALDTLGWFPTLARWAEVVAGTLGPVLATYTAVLLADTAVPAWHDARATLPFVFAGSSLASAGAGAVLATAGRSTGVAGRLVVTGAGLELAAGVTMERSLGSTVARPYRQGPAARLHRAARVLTAAGTALVAVGRRRPPVAGTGAALVLAGSACTRWAVFRAGQESARDPAATIAPH